MQDSGSTVWHLFVANYYVSNMSHERICVEFSQTVASDKPRLVSRLSGTQNVHSWSTWYLFSCDHDALKIGPEF